MPRLQLDDHVPGRFPTTHWSRVITAASRDASEAREALSSLCQAYWYPIYAYIRHRGYAPEQARDLTQDYFAYVLERGLFAKADPARGASARSFVGFASANWRPGGSTRMRRRGEEAGLLSRSTRLTPNAGTCLNLPTK